MRSAHRPKPTDFSPREASPLQLAGKARYFKSIEGWRNWLSENHAEGEPVWVVIQKKSSTNPGIGYEEAVLEAVAYGWIDGKMRSLNGDEFIQRFSPRRNNSVWSLKNRERAELLISEGRMTPAGLETVREAKGNGRWQAAHSSSRGPIDVPDDLAAALKEKGSAERNFNSFPPSARFTYVHWINEAKRQDTRKRRIRTVVDRSMDNLKPGIDLRVAKD